MSGCKMEVKKNRFRQIATRTMANVQRAVTKTAKMVQRTAKSHAPKDTGALRESIYTITPNDGSGYAVATMNASLKNIDARMKANTGKRAQPAAKVNFNPEAPVITAFEAYVAVAVDYGIWIEYGTNRAPAHPFFIPSFATHRQDFKEALREALQKAAASR